MNAAQAALLDLFLDDEDFSSSSSDSSSDWGLMDDPGWSDLEYDFLTVEEASASTKKHTVFQLSDVKSLRDAEFFENFRVSRSLVEDLSEKFKKSPFYNQNAGKHGKIGAYRQILVFLWFAGHQVSFREGSERFDITTSTLHRIIKRVSTFLRSIFEEAIKWPDEAECMESVDYFRQKGIPLVLGAVNVTQIEIDKPLQGWNPYKNAISKKFSVQVICDHKKRIIHMYAGAPGSETVSDVFEGSGLAQGLEAACGKFSILADHGFPCIRNLIVPFRDKEGLTESQERFNQLLKVGKTVVDGCFVQLRRKFPQLAHCRLRSLEDICNFITACCVLHNFSLEDNFMSEEVPEPPPDHNSFYFLANRDRDVRNYDYNLADSPDGISYRNDLLQAISMARNWN